MSGTVQTTSPRGDYAPGAPRDMRGICERCARSAEGKSGEDCTDRRLLRRRRGTPGTRCARPRRNRQSFPVAAGACPGRSSRDRPGIEPAGNGCRATAAEIRPKGGAPAGEEVGHRGRDPARGTARWPTSQPEDFWLFSGLDPASTLQVQRLLARRIRFRRGDPVFRIGDPFVALYAIRVGSCKTTCSRATGQDQVAGYHMAGEVIGMDGIGTGIHECQATALEDMEVCVRCRSSSSRISRGSAPSSCATCTGCCRRRIPRRRTLMLVLGTMRAEQRLAVFLLDLSQRYRSARLFVVRVRAADDARRDRELPRAQAGNREPAVLPISARRADPVQGRNVKLLDRVALEPTRRGLALIGPPHSAVRRTLRDGWRPGNIMIYNRCSRARGSA